MKNSTPAALSFPPIREEDYAEVKSLAELIWPEAYRGIISPAQIDYMIRHRYASSVIAAEIREGGIHYAWILEAGSRVGFLAYGPVRPGAICHLDKLYLLPSRHGVGIGSATLQWLLQTLAECGTGSLELRVNRKNSPAIRCYQRNGFQILREDCLDIGGGFVMDDFLMSRSVTA